VIDDMDRSAPKPRKSATQVGGVIGRAEHCLLFFVGGALKGGGARVLGRASWRLQGRPDSTYGTIANFDCGHNESHGYHQHPSRNTTQQYHSAVHAELTNLQADNVCQGH